MSSSSNSPNGLSRRSMLRALAAVPVLPNLLGTASAETQTSPASGSSGSGFSFAVYGDSRPMMYLPFKNDGQPDLTKLFVELFGLVMPEKIAEEVVKRDVKTIFDPATKELIRVIMPFMSKTEVMTLSVDRGWVAEASVEDVVLLPGVHRTMFRLEGGDWVAREIVRDVQTGRARFVVNSGDVVWWGNQGRTLADSPYWQRVNDTMLKQLPAPDSEMLEAGLEGRWFMAVGNHEVWGDPQIEGVLNAVPYLKKFGVTPENLIYTFDFRGVRFIFLWSGKYDYRSPSLWDGDRPKYEEQQAIASAAIERLEKSRPKWNCWSVRASRELRKPDNFSTFVSSPPRGWNGADEVEGICQVAHDSKFVFQTAIEHLIALFRQWCQRNVTPLSLQLAAVAAQQSVGQRAQLTDVRIPSPAQ